MNLLKYLYYILAIKALDIRIFLAKGRRNALVEENKRLRKRLEEQ